MDFNYQRYYHGSIKAVILDWAGTTVDYGSFAPTAVFIRLFADNGVRISPTDARSGMGMMKKDHLRTILSRSAVAEAWETTHAAPVTEKDIDHLFENFIPMQLDVLKDYADPIPGVLEVVKTLRQHGIKIGSTTGYIRSMMDVLAPEAAKRGYQPDCIVCPDEVPAGRPYPWMCYQNSAQLGVFPLEAMVKVGDTSIDVEEGLNAGMWTVGLSLSGNLVGLTENDLKSLPGEKRKALAQAAEAQLLHSGAHYVIEGLWDLPVVLEDIESRLAHGEHP